MDERFCYCVCICSSSVWNSDSVTRRKLWILLRFQSCWPTHACTIPRASSSIFVVVVVIAPDPIRAPTPPKWMPQLTLPAGPLSSSSWAPSKLFWWRWRAWHCCDQRVLVSARVKFCLLGTFSTYSYCSFGCERVVILFLTMTVLRITDKEHQIHPLNHDEHRRS